MTAFEVYVNKAKVCTVGVNDLETIMANLACVMVKGEKRIHFAVTGLEKKKLYTWVKCPMDVGSQIEIKIVDASRTDAAKHIIDLHGGGGGGIKPPEISN